MESANEVVTECGICCQEYDADKRLPRVLTCLHTSCTTCLNDRLVTEETGCIKCPRCGAASEAIADVEKDLPVDSATRNYVEFLRVQRKPNEIPCTDCPDEEFAEVFCKDCHSFMCRLCADAHKRTQITRKHATTPLSDMKAYGMDEFHKKDTCNKQGHEEQVYTFYCDRRGCDKPVCTLCAVCDHNQTNGHLIRNLSDVYEDSKAVVESVVRDLNTKERPVTESIDILQRLLNDLEEKETDIGVEIDEIFDKLVTIVNSRREQLHKEVENHCSTKKKDLDGKLKYLRSYATNVQSAMEFVSRTVSYSSATEFLLMKNAVLQRLLELKNLTFTAPSKEDVTVKFYKGINDDSFIQLVNGIGSVTSRDIASTNHINQSSLSKHSSSHRDIDATRSEEPEKLPKQSTSGQPTPPVPFQRHASSPNMKEKPVFERQNSAPLNNGLKDAIINARNEILGRQNRFASTSGVNGTSSSVSPKEEKSFTFGRPTGSAVLQRSSNDPGRKLRPPPAMFKSDSKSAPMGLGDFLKELEDRGDLPRTLCVDKNARPPKLEGVTTPERTFKPIASPTKLTSPRSPRSPVTAGQVPTNKEHVDGKELAAPLPTSPSASAVFGDVICPEFLFDVETIHSEREVSFDGKILRNRKTGSPSIAPTGRQLQKYKGVIGSFGFKDPGKYYYEVNVSFTIQQPLEETWLIFELGLSRADEIDLHHTVERHEHARSCYVARYPEDGKLAQEFWHNRDLLTYVPLCDNVAGLSLDVTYGLLVDTKKRKWVVADVKKEKKLYTFNNLNMSEPLIPVFGTYNPDLVGVEMTLRTGQEITSFPSFLKGF